MTREKWALLLLLALAAGSCWNIHAANKLCADIETRLCRVEAAARIENWDEAQAAIESAIERWESAEGYTHIFIRHPELDSCTDIFYDTFSTVLKKDSEELYAALEKLRYHIDSIAGMERPVPGNIF